MKLYKLTLAALLLLAFPLSASAQTTLRIFTGGQQRPDVMRKIADEYQKKNPNVKVEVEVGGATSEAQQQYLSTVLSSKDSALDVILIDVIRPAQWAAQGWAEPLDSYLGADKAKIMAQYLKAYADADQVNGKLIALPYFADSQFLYYRKDLVPNPPRTWEEMMADCAVAKQRGIDCYAGQFAKYEGLTVNVAEAINTAGGQVVTTLLDRDARAASPAQPR